MDWHLKAGNDIIYPNMKTRYEGYCNVYNLASDLYKDMSHVEYIATLKGREKELDKYPSYCLGRIDTNTGALMLFGDDTNKQGLLLCFSPMYTHLMVFINAIPGSGADVLENRTVKRILNVFDYFSNNNNHEVTQGFMVTFTNECPNFLQFYDGIRFNFSMAGADLTNITLTEMKIALFHFRFLAYEDVKNF